MALGNMTLRYSQKKADGSTLVFNSANNGTATELVGIGASAAVAVQQIKDQIQTSINLNQGNVDDQTAAKAAFG